MTVRQPQAEYHIYERVYKLSGSSISSLQQFKKLVYVCDLCYESISSNVEKNLYGGIGKVLVSQSIVVKSDVKLNVLLLKGQPSML